MKKLLLYFLVLTCFFSHKILHADDFGNFSDPSVGMSADEAAAYAASNGIPTGGTGDFGMQQPAQGYYQDPSLLSTQQPQYPNQQPYPQQLQPQTPVTYTQSTSGDTMSTGAIAGTAVGGTGVLGTAGALAYMGRGKGRGPSSQQVMGIDAAGNPYPVGTGLTTEQMVAQQTIGRQKISGIDHNYGDIMEDVDKKTGAVKLKIKRASNARLLFWSKEDVALYEYRLARSKEMLRQQTIKNAGLSSVAMPPPVIPQQQPEQPSLLKRIFTPTPTQRTVSGGNPTGQQGYAQRPTTRPQVIGSGIHSQLSTPVPHRTSYQPARPQRIAPRR